MMNASIVFRSAICLLVALAAAMPGARGAELEGVELPDSVRISDHELTLNGMGLRKKAFFKIYVAGLYLPERRSDAAAILAADAPRHLVMSFKFGVSAKQMCGAWEEGLEGNTPDASAEVAEQFETLCSWMEDLSKTDEMTVTYVPGEGTSIGVKGTDKGILEGKAFADALFACWLGPEPPGKALKEGLLGG